MTDMDDQVAVSRCDHDRDIESNYFGGKATT